LERGPGERDSERVRGQAWFHFPYVIDETQDVARAYGAQCIPDFFGFNAQDELNIAGGSTRRAYSLRHISPRPVRSNEAGGQVAR
jgi:hypothetical protein